MTMTVSMKDLHAVVRILDRLPDEYDRQNGTAVYYEVSEEEAAQVIRYAK